MVYPEGYLTSDQRANEKANELIAKFGSFKVAMDWLKKI